MRISKKHISLDFCIKALEKNEIFIFPCDTVYGFIGRVPEGDNGIRNIKGREETKAFLQLASSISMVESFSKSELPSFLDKYWPGPLTVVIDNKEGGTTAFRVPDDPFLREMSEKAGCPIYSTSVNRSGFPPMAAIDEIVEEFEGETAFIVDGGDMKSGIPSTLLDLTVRPYKILRQGELVIPEEILE